MSTSSFMVYLIPWAIRQGIQYPSVRRALKLPPSQHSKDSYEDAEYSRIGGDEENEPRGSGSAAVLPKLTTRETMKLSAQFCLLWFVVCIQDPSPNRVSGINSNNELYRRIGLLLLA